MTWVSLALAIVGGLGIGSWISGRWERRHATDEAEKQREHASVEARKDRQYALRLDGYRAASQYLERARLWVQLTEPLMTPAAAPPKPMEPNDEWIELGSTIAIAASDEVQVSMGEAVEAQRGFLYAVDEYRARKADPKSNWEPDNPKGPVRSCTMRGS